MRQRHLLGFLISGLLCRRFASRIGNHRRRLVRLIIFVDLLLSHLLSSLSPLSLSFILLLHRFSILQLLAVSSYLLLSLLFLVSEHLHLVSSLLVLFAPLFP